MKIRALVFEDDEVIRALLSSLLESRGYDVRAYPDPLQAPFFPENGRSCSRQVACCDLIISDVNMPGMSGLEMVEKHQQNHCHVQNIALMSGAWNREQRNQAEKLGCKVFKKPFSFSEIISWLDHCEKNVEPHRRLMRMPKAS
jgi:CheY-like chemotaxis protein